MRLAGNNAVEQKFIVAVITIAVYLLGSDEH